MDEFLKSGRILEEERGTGGLGYDPIFIPAGDTRTYAEMTMAEKAQTSHRGRALAQFVDYLTATYGG